MAATTLEPIVTDVTVEDLQAEHPHAVCTPLRGTTRVLPPKATPVAERMEWTWTTIDRETAVDGAHVRIGDRADTYRLAGPAALFEPGQPNTIWARLQDLHLD